MSTTAPAKNPAGGRPSEFSDDVAAAICGQLALGKSLRTVCKAPEMPSLMTVYNWLGKYPSFVEQYARAKEDSADALAEDILDIADDADEDVQRSKLKVDTRKWLASKLKAKKYGDKADVNVSGGLSLTIGTIKSFE